MHIHIVGLKAIILYCISYNQRLWLYVWIPCKWQHGHEQTSCAGDKPEQLYPEARQELEAMGFQSTIDYVAEACQAVVTETGLLPHVNAGVMGRDDLIKLKRVSGSQGLMLESTSDRLLQPGMPHHECPDKAGAS